MFQAAFFRCWVETGFPSSNFLPSNTSLREVFEGRDYLSRFAAGR